MDYLSLTEYDIQIQDDSSQVESLSAVNTGFQFVISNRKTVGFYKTVYTLTQTNPELQDQRAYNTILQNSEFKHILKWKVLDPLLYPNGWIYFVEQLPQKNNIKPIIIHNNWIRGLSSKIHRFREQHLYFIDNNNYYLDPSVNYLTYTNINPNIHSYLDQTEELREAILLANLLNRTLILPPLKVFSSDNDLDFVTAEMLYNMDEFCNVIPFKEHGFITNEKHRNEQSPLLNSHFVDISVGEFEPRPCYEQNSCFIKGHQGFMKFDKAVKVHNRKLLTLNDIHNAIGDNSSRKNVRVLVLPTILGIFDNLESQFNSTYLESLDNAITLRKAPHL